MDFLERIILERVVSICCSIARRTQCSGSMSKQRAGKKATLEEVSLISGEGNLFLLVVLHLSVM